jgi:hypothetical protein
MKKLILFFLFLLSFTLFGQTIPVTFQCNMSVQISEGNFDPGADVLVVRGSFQTAAGDTANWYGDMFPLTDPDGDSIYTITVDIDDSNVGTTFEFKYAISPDNWEGVANRTFTLENQPMTLPVVFFNNVSQVIVNTLTFLADISGILGIGAGGAFDPSQDSLLVMGLDWEGGTNVTGNRTMVEDPFNPGHFSTTLSVEATGDSTKWKFKAYPDDRFSGAGWELTPDRWYVYGPNGTNVTLPEIVPSIFPLQGPINNPVDVTFDVDMSNAVNKYNSVPIDPSTIYFVGQRGDADFLGSWVTGGTWTPDDTIGGAHMKVLTNAGNNIWTRTVTVPAGTPGGVYSYKFGADYPGADTVNNGTEYMDNEMPFAVNHFFNLVDGDPIEILINFGQQLPVSVEKLDDLMPDKFTLEQNYPNPFNPTTTIRYSITNPGLINLKIFNMLGEEVMVLVNEEQTTGVYEVTLDASRLSSGIYLYTLTNGKYTATKKMTLLK